MTDETALSAMPVIEAAPAQPTSPAQPSEQMPRTQHGSPPRITAFSEFARVLRTRPDWLYGLLCSWALGLGTFAFLLAFTRPDLAHPMNAVVVPVILTAVADGSLTNQLAAEPRWAADLLRSGADPGRILLARNLLLAVWELLFVAIVVALTVRLGHSAAWVRPALPQLAVLPIASIAIGNLASVLMPCPFMRMSKRFQAVGTWARWTIYIAIPWGLSSVALAMWALPVYLEWRWEPRVVTHVLDLKHYAPTVQHAAHTYIMIWVVIIPLWHLTVWLISLRLAQTLARMRKQGLIKLMERHLDLNARLPDLSFHAAARQLPRRIREIPKDLRGELGLLGSGLLEATATAARLWVP
ncbi:hypothetical protein KGA66_13550 [Actinocrinis puniceicyclus]|uniref:Uncharacterized protein n=1 Tax=Actinocrinis puniceicyclus TaxID=977794 RepID=A0A8J7WPQ6_9ACTN|nr:hypothetical protein [Actinocrinis puniceicyclus]MBS2964077.1 hypothetical protein [Actinocrinis puniceicyclus]